MRLLQSHLRGARVEDSNGICSSVKAYSHKSDSGLQCLSKSLQLWLVWLAVPLLACCAANSSWCCCLCTCSKESPLAFLQSSYPFQTEALAACCCCKFTCLDVDFHVKKDCFDFWELKRHLRKFSSEAGSSLELPGASFGNSSVE